MSVRAREQAQANYLALYGGDYGQFTPITRQENRMQFTIERAALLAAVKLARVAVATRSSLPVLSHFLLEADERGLVITASDYEIAMAATAPAVVKEPGRATVPAQLFAAMLAQCAAPTLTVSLDKKRVRLTGTGTKLALPSLDPDDFPIEGVTGEATPLADCDAAQLRAAVGRVAFAVAEEGSRAVLCGVHLRSDGDTLTLSACDNYRMARTTLPIRRPAGAADVDCTIPAKALAGLIGALPDGQLAIGGCRSLVVLSTATATATARTVDGVYPDLDAILPRSYSLTARAPRAALHDAARLARYAAASALGGKDAVAVLDLAVGPDGTTLSGGDESEAEVTVPHLAPPEGAATLAANADYLAEALGALAGDAATLRVGVPSGILVITPGDAADDATIHGIMPVHRGA